MCEVRVLDVGSDRTVMRFRDLGESAILLRERLIADIERSSIREFESQWGIGKKRARVRRRRGNVWMLKLLGIHPAPEDWQSLTRDK